MCQAGMPRVDTIKSHADKNWDSVGNGPPKHRQLEYSPLRQMAMLAQDKQSSRPPCPVLLPRFLCTNHDFR